MCLENVKTKRSKKALEDITVYKLIKKRPNHMRENDLDEWATPFQWGQVIFNEVLKSDLRRVNNEQMVEKGFHSFKNLASALALKSKIAAAPENIRIVECVIPKGSKYYEGTFGDDAYASNQIKYLKIIETE